MLTMYNTNPSMMNKLSFDKGHFVMNTDTGEITVNPTEVNEWWNDGIDCVLYTNCRECIKFKHR